MTFFHLLEKKPISVDLVNFGLEDVLRGIVNYTFLESLLICDRLTPVAALRESFTRHNNFFTTVRLSCKPPLSL